MKNQITTLIIGILIGAIIATGVFLVLKDDNKSKMPNMGERGQISDSIRDSSNSNSNNSDTSKTSTDNAEQNN